jgi:hypothetical protein
MHEGLIGLFPLPFRRWLSFWMIFFAAVWCERFTAVTLTRCETEK